MGSDSEAISAADEPGATEAIDGDSDVDRDSCPRGAAASRGLTGDRDPSEPDDTARVLLLMCPGRDRDLVADALGERYRVDTATETGALDREFDCCVLDGPGFDRVGDAIATRRATADPVFVPFALLLGGRSADVPADAWNRVDDVIELPVKRRALVARIDNLIQRRTTSRRLSETVDELRLKERAMDEAPVGITLATARRESNPLVYCNEGFEQLTGYGPEMLGKDCRFLQGEDTDDETRETLREAIDAERPIAVDILNYRANGQKFWNRLSIAPLRDESDAVTHYVGFQTDITERKIRERRLEVMGRVLNHNLRNKMNLIEGYADLLRSDVEGEKALHSLDVIADTAADLMGIARAVQKIDGTLSEGDSAEPTDLREHLIEVRNRTNSRYPNATVVLVLPDDDPIPVSVVGLVTAIEEGVENAVKHNDATEPTVEIQVERLPDGWIGVEIEDDGPGIPDHETHVLEAGETSLTHADRLGIWLMYWVVNRAGGEFTVTTDETGTLLRLEVPTDP